MCPADVSHRARSGTDVSEHGWPASMQDEAFTDFKRPRPSNLSSGRRPPGAAPSNSRRRSLTFVCLSLSLCCTTAKTSRLDIRPPPLSLVEDMLLTTARETFGGREDVYAAVMQSEYDAVLAGPGVEEQTPFIACSKFPKKSLALLEAALKPSFIRRVGASDHHNTCFLVTMKLSEFMSANPASFLLEVFAPFAPSLKLAPGLLDYGHASKDAALGMTRLQTTYGRTMLMDNVIGLTVELSPGAVREDDLMGTEYEQRVLDDLMSPSIHFANFNVWMDPAASGGVLRTSVEGALRVREWTRAADLMHDLMSASNDEIGAGPGRVCGWGNITIHRAGLDVLLISGMDHLLPSGRGPDTPEKSDALMACFMMLISHLAFRPEVLRIAPYHSTQLFNAVAKTITFSATTDAAESPLTAAGLNGTGEIIQIIDSGLDQESCFFRDEDGEPVEGGYYFDDLVIGPEISVYPVYNGGSFITDLERRKIVQYTSLVRPYEGGQDDYTSYFTTEAGRQFPYYRGDGFATETAGGHGSHTAGTAAGSTLSTPADVPTCSGDDMLGCVGSCLNTSTVERLTSNTFLNVDTACPRFDCDGYGTSLDTCLSDETPETLSAQGGIAPGAQLAIFDVSEDGVLIWAELALNGLWDAVNETDCVIHSNSWGGQGDCVVDATCTEFDTYMYQNPEHLLIFAAGNSGDVVTSTCTVGSPAIAKNVLAVGSSSSGATRWSATSANGDELGVSSTESSNEDTVSFFSARGLTLDDRIKPEILAPGDRVLSASGADEEGGQSCRLELQLGTSMSTPVVAGAAALIRQYFKDRAFYASDLAARGLCGTNSTESAFICGPFHPSAATLKAMLINSANLMGGSSEPDGSRGFGRVHLDAGLPLGGAGDMGLFVADSMNTSIGENSVDSYVFETVDGDTGEFRATLAWIDPQAATLSTIQLIHDLDLRVSSPSGKAYTMWLSGEADSRNVIERVIVSEDDFNDEPVGEWTVSVSSSDLSTESQSYSLVVQGPFGDGARESSSGVSQYRGCGNVACVLGVCLLLSLVSIYPEH